LDVEGVALRVHPSQIILWDGVEAATMAHLGSDATGKISAEDSSVVNFADAFGQGIDLQYVVRNGDFHQDVVFKEPLALPEGMDEGAAYLSVYSEFNLDELAQSADLRVSTLDGPVSLPPPGAATEPLCELACYAPGAKAPLFSFVRSRAYDSPAAGVPGRSDWVEKRIIRDESGRAFLVETIPFSMLKDASSPFVLDYIVSVPGGYIGHEYWEARHTYVIEGSLYVNGTLTIEPGTTIKIRSGRLIQVNGKIVARGEPSNFITFTSTNDDSCGETVSGSTGNPSPGDYITAFYLTPGSSQESVVTRCKIGYAYCGIYDYGVNLSSSIASNIVMYSHYAGICLIHCNTACHNNLVAESPGPGIYLQMASKTSPENGYVSNNTVDGCYQGIYVYDTYNYEIKDNLLTRNDYGVYASSCTGLDMHHNRFWCPDQGQVPWWGVPDGGNNTPLLTANPYVQDAEILNLGQYYVNEVTGGGALVRDNGSQPDAQTVFPGDTYTVIPPPASQVYDSDQTLGDTTWSKVAHDTGQLDIGYHHGRVDVFADNANLVVSDASPKLVIEPGVVVGMRGYKCIMASDAGKLVSLGDPSAGGYNLITCSKSLSMHMESPSLSFMYPCVGISSSADADSCIQFTRATWLGWGVIIGRELNHPIRDNVFSLAKYGIHANVAAGGKVFSNLMCGNLTGAYVSGNWEVVNCTFDRNQTGLQVYAGGGQTLHVRDSLFTKNDDEGILIDSCPGQVFNYYNAFWGNGQHIGGGSLGNGSQNLTQSPYDDWTASDWQDRYRLDQDSSIIDGGNAKAADMGLAAYTTAPRDDNRYDTRHVDVGFHFLARPTLFVDGSYQDEYGAGAKSRLRPYKTIGDALSEAETGETVLVLPGTYYYEQCQQVAMVSCVDLIGSGVDATVLDAQRFRTPSDPLTSCPLIKIDSRSDAALGALTITGRFNEQWPSGKNEGYGGGVICKDSTGIVVRDCLVSYNDADYGGGLYIENSNVTVEDCIIHQNKAISGIAGGGLYVKSCSSSQGRKVTVTRCVISNNAAGAPLEQGIGGGGIFCTSASDPEIEHCVISHNRAGAGHGGGIYLDTGCDATIVNCIVEHNIARHNMNQYPNYCSLGLGGGIYVHNSSPVISGCTISNNGSITRGAGISCYGGSSSPMIVNCTVAYNADLLPGDEWETAGIWSDGAWPTVVNSIVWGNDCQQLASCEDVTYSCIQGGHEGEGNIPDPPDDPDFPGPLFVGSIYGPYHLGYGSPCIEVGTTDPNKLPDGYTFPEFDVDGDARTVWVDEVRYVDMGSDQRHPFRQMVGIKRDYIEGKVIITWGTEDGKGYRVYSSDDPFSDHMVWEYRGAVIGTGGPVSWEDTIDFLTADQGFYKVRDKNGTYAGMWTRPIGFVTAEVEDVDQDPEKYESTLFAMPLEPMYEAINAPGGDYNESLARMIAGHRDLEGEYLEDGDKIEFLRLGCHDTPVEPDDSVKLQLQWVDGQPKWYTCVPGEDPTESQDRFHVAGVFRVVEGSNGSRGRITFVGHVPSRRVGLLPFRSLWEYYSVYFAYPYPVHTTLNDIPFLEHGAIGNPGRYGLTADRIYTPSPRERPQSRELWLKDDEDERGVWMDDDEHAGSPFIDVLPGKGFHYRAEARDPEYSGGVGYVCDNTYWRRVPVPCPYRSE
jgi:parallel beta-helix repeat protein